MAVGGVSGLGTGCCFCGDCDEGSYLELEPFMLGLLAVGNRRFIRGEPAQHKEVIRQAEHLAHVITGCLCSCLAHCLQYTSHGTDTIMGYGQQRQLGPFLHVSQTASELKPAVTECIIWQLT